jgi:predicted RNase H-like HicB family nuclease
MDKNLINKAKKLASRPYIVEVDLDETTDGQPVFIAKTPELEGCFGQGETIEEAINSLNDARVDYIYSLLEDNLYVPGPFFANTTTANLTSTLTLRYSQSDLANPGDTKNYNKTEKFSYYAKA